MLGALLALGTEGRPIAGTAVEGVGFPRPASGLKESIAAGTTGTPSIFLKSSMRSFSWRLASSSAGVGIEWLNPKISEKKPLPVVHEVFSLLFRSSLESDFKAL